MYSSDTPSMLRMLEAIRQENKREREEIKTRLSSIEAMVGQLLERDNAATPIANRDAKISIGSHAESYYSLYLIL